MKRFHGIRAFGLITLLGALLSMLTLGACSFKQPGLEHSRPAGGPEFWIGDTGPTGPRFSGPQQYPFICTTLNEGLGQPLIDNQAGIGNAVFRETLFGPWIYGEPVGYSRWCSIRTRVDYYYFSLEKDEFLPLDNRGRVPGDVERINIDGRDVDFVVSVERGTINRFLYSIAMLAPDEESLAAPQTLDNSAWNKRLVYKFRGGVGIGRWQGESRLDREQALHYQSLKRGYAVAFSSGTSSATHYNMELARETAEMVKQHFVATYGAPEFTIGVGGSGGAIQQYLLAQNSPALLDGSIPQLSYPDMVTQIGYVADCDLLERYFDEQFQAAPDSKWGDWLFRARIAGLSANTVARTSSEYDNPYAPPRGASTCSRSWRGHVQVVMNPDYSHPAYQRALKLFRYPAAVRENIIWTHWNDLANIYPQDENGYGETTWDNVGVQYGLRALRDGTLGVDEFLDLNACVGGWKQPNEMRLGDYPWNPDADPARPDPWDAANMNLNPDCKRGKPAPRSQASQAAIAAAIESGQVFRGDIEIPVIDLRWYLDPALDIHHSLGSFSARARMIAAKGHADNQVIWVAGCERIDPFTLEKSCPYDPTGDALDVMAQWLSRGRPDDAIDRCLDYEGKVLHAGPDVLDGILGDGAPGACTRLFPVHSSARMAAGEDITGDSFKCALKAVDKALNDASYGHIRFNTQQRQRLRQIFPHGVCDYPAP